ncbi:hypothetical protein GCM10010412_100820 [Nonomuraea recticatena]|uniref:Transposase IS4-like domain-containing protein n=1 Tax=Nonomuraea recticatena TaxID=46178 RepID=A0ABN3TGY5_9ACTN
MSLTGGNRDDVTQLMLLIKAIPPVRGRVGRPRKRPDCLYADRGYDHDKYRRLVWRTGIKPRIARRGTPHGSGLGVHRWVVERTIALLHWFRRLRIRWEVRDDIHEAFMALAAADHLLAAPCPLIFLLGPFSARVQTDPCACCVGPISGEMVT